MASEAEVAQQRCPVGGDEDVRRLDVAMHDAGVVRRVERSGNLLDDLDRALRGQRALAAQQLAQVDALDIRHRDVQEAVLLAAAQDAHDVWIRHRGDELHLAQEALAEPLVARQLGGEQLQCHGRSVGVAREVHGAGRALAERPLDT
jgi:hypothetical protein